MAPSHEVKWMKWKSLIHIWLFATPWTIQSMEFSRQNTRVDSLFLLQGIFPNQGLNPGLLYCRQILYQLSHKGSPRILEWVAYSFSRGSSLPRNWTGVSCIAGEFFTNWAIREALSISWCWQMWHFPPVIYMTDFLSHFSNIYLNITTYKRIPPPSLSHRPILPSLRFWQTFCKDSSLVSRTLGYLACPVLFFPFTHLPCDGVFVRTCV